MTKSNLEREVMYLFSVYILGHHPLREVTGRTESEAMEECCLLACVLWLVQIALLYNLGHSAKGWHCPQ